ncbi:hypothetical protein [Amorphus coralli]|uniref:hypothetical protein n=1 Tax=Amorphus coralli TaxID=340680 RepID=UPI00035E4C27|nr:hypothetical protein [Amorphus coralli]
MPVNKPPYVQAKTLKHGMSFYWVPPSKYKKFAEAAGEPFPFTTVALGTNLSQHELDAAAEPHNTIFAAWLSDRTERNAAAGPRYGTLRWLLMTVYLEHKVFTRKVSERSRPDYVRLFRRLCELPTKSGKGKVGEIRVDTITVAAAQRLYDRLIDEWSVPQANKAIRYLTPVWERLRQYYPEMLGREKHSAPWLGVAKEKHVRVEKTAVDRDTVYRFAEAAIAEGRPECAAAAVICFEWLQRPENVVGGKIRWGDYRNRDWPNALRIEHHKNGAFVWHPLEAEDPETGEQVLFYADAEAVLQQLPRRGVSMILGPQGQQYQGSRFAHIVRGIADRAGLPEFSLDACRHGGLNELEEAGLTDGQGMALSGHKTKTAYRGYMKRSLEKALAPTMKRMAHRDADYAAGKATSGRPRREPPVNRVQKKARI